MANEYLDYLYAEVQSPALLNEKTRPIAHMNLEFTEEIRSQVKQLNIYVRELPLFVAESRELNQMMSNANTSMVKKVKAYKDKSKALTHAREVIKHDLKKLAPQKKQTPEIYPSLAQVARTKPPKTAYPINSENGASDVKLKRSPLLQEHAWRGKVKEVSKEFMHSHGRRRSTRFMIGAVSLF